jgi:hypothetical protein
MKPISAYQNRLIAAAAIRTHVACQRFQDASANYQHDDDRFVPYDDAEREYDDATAELEELIRAFLEKP